MAHARDLATRGPTEAELERARHTQRCALEYLLDDPASLASHFSWLNMYLPDPLPHTVETESARLAHTTQDDVAAAAKSALRLEHATALCVGPAPDDLVDLLRDATGSAEVERLPKD